MRFCSALRGALKYLEGDLADSVEEGSDVVDEAMVPSEDIGADVSLAPRLIAVLLSESEGGVEDPDGPCFASRPVLLLLEVRLLESLFTLDGVDIDCSSGLMRPGMSGTLGSTCNPEQTQR